MRDTQTNYPSPTAQASVLHFISSEANQACNKQEPLPRLALYQFHAPLHSLMTLALPHTRAATQDAPMNKTASVKPHILVCLHNTRVGSTTRAAGQNDKHPRPCYLPAPPALPPRQPTTRSSLLKYRQTQKPRVNFSSTHYEDNW